MQLGGFERWDVALATRRRLRDGWCAVSDLSAPELVDVELLDAAISRERAEVIETARRLVRAQGGNERAEKDAVAQAMREMGGG